MGYVTNLQRAINNLLLLCTSYTTLWVECEVHHIHILSSNSAKVTYQIVTLPRSVTFTLNSVLCLHRLQRNTEFSCNVAFPGLLPTFLSFSWDGGEDDFILESPPGSTTISIHRSSELDGWRLLSSNTGQILQNRKYRKLGLHPLSQVPASSCPVSHKDSAYWRYEVDG